MAIWVIASAWVWGPGARFAATRFAANVFQAVTALLRLAALAAPVLVASAAAARHIAASANRRRG